MTADRDGQPARFIVEIPTTTGKICEGYATYAEARRRVEVYPGEGLTGTPLIFEELPDSSQRIVRDDGKPLQWHRLPWDEPEGPAEAVALSDATDAPAPLPLDDEPIGLCEVPADFQYRSVERPPREPEDDDERQCSSLRPNG